MKHYIIWYNIVQRWSLYMSIPYNTKWFRTLFMRWCAHLVSDIAAVLQHAATYSRVIDVCHIHAQYVCFRFNSITCKQHIVYNSVSVFVTTIGWKAYTRLIPQYLRTSCSIPMLILVIYCFACTDIYLCKHQLQHIRHACMHASIHWRWHWRWHWQRHPHTDAVRTSGHNP